MNFIRLLILNGSLKPEEKVSNTEELAGMLLDSMWKQDANMSAEIVRLHDLEIPHGIEHREPGKDDWPKLEAKILDADIIVFASPVWWGGHSSHIQQVFERIDSLDEDYIETGRSLLYNKVAGVLVTGAEDGGFAVMSRIVGVLTWLGFTLPPECGAYWTGEVGNPAENPVAVMAKSEAVNKMVDTMARNLVAMAQELKRHPLPSGATRGRRTEKKETSHRSAQTSGAGAG